MKSVIVLMANCFKNEIYKNIKLIAVPAFKIMNENKVEFIINLLVSFSVFLI